MRVRKTLLTYDGEGRFRVSYSFTFVFFFVGRGRGGKGREGRAWVLTVTKELNTVTACFVFRGGVARVAL